MLLDFTAGELLEGQTITPGWYKARILSNAYDTTRKADTIDGVVKFKFLEGQLAADDRTIKHTFWNMLGSGKGFLRPYIAALKKKTIMELVEDVKSGKPVNFDFEANVGQDVLIKVGNELVPNTGRLINKVVDFLPINAEIPSAA